MVVKVYISGISGNKEVKKRQQRVLLILDSRNIKYEVIDIAEPGSEEQKDFMQNNSTSPGATISDPNPRHPLPPQIFNGDIYCGDYDQFDLANEVDEMEKFLKITSDEPATVAPVNPETKIGNGEIASNEESVKNGTGDTDKAAENKSDDEKTDTKVEENAAPIADKKEVTPEKDVAETTKTDEEKSKDSA